MTDYRSAPRTTNDSTIARLRIERGLTQAQLAKKVGCQSKDISRWETGVHKPGSAYLIKIADALGCTIDEIAR